MKSFFFFLFFFFFRWIWWQLSPGFSGALRPQDQRVDDGGQHDDVSRRSGSQHAGSPALRCGRPWQLQLPQLGGSLRPRYRQVRVSTKLSVFLSSLFECVAWTYVTLPKKTISKSQNAILNNSHVKVKSFFQFLAKTYFIAFYSAICILISSVKASFFSKVTNIPGFLMHVHIY